MKLKNLGEFNKIYNFQDTIILFEIFKQRSKQNQKLYKHMVAHIEIKVFNSSSH